jgi:hypothetical protein
MPNNNNVLSNLDKELEDWEKNNQDIDVYSSNVKRALHDIMECAPNCFPDIPLKDIAIERHEKSCIVRYDEMITESEIIASKYTVDYNDIFVDVVTLSELRHGCFMESHEICIHDSLFALSEGFQDIKQDISRFYEYMHSMLHYEEVKNELFSIKMDYRYSRKENITMAIDAMLKQDTDEVDICDVYRIPENFAEIGSNDIIVLKEDVTRYFEELVECYRHFYGLKDTSLKDTSYNPKDDDKFDEQQLNKYAIRYISYYTKMVADKLLVYSKLCQREEDMDDGLVFLYRYSKRLLILASLFYSLDGSVGYYGLNIEYEKEKELQEYRKFEE